MYLCVVFVYDISHRIDSQVHSQSSRRTARYHNIGGISHAEVLQEGAYGDIAIDLPSHVQYLSIEFDLSVATVGSTIAILDMNRIPIVHVAVSHGVVAEVVLDLGFRQAG